MTLNQDVRVVTDADIKQYTPLVKKFLRQNVMKNWNEASMYNGNYDITLGNTGMSMNDIEQHLFTELVVALQKYNPNYRTPPKYELDSEGNQVLDDNGNPVVSCPGGKSVKEITFVTTHLYNRCGQLMKRLANKSKGYGMWSSDLSTIFAEENRGE